MMLSRRHLRPSDTQSMLLLAAEIFRCCHTLLLCLVRTGPRNFLVLLTEESVIQRDGLDPLHVEVVQQVWIEVKEDGHVDCLARVQSLFLEAEALNLAKVRRALRRRDTVGRYADDVLVAVVGGLVKSECGLARQNPYFALLRDKLPRQRVGYRGVERDFDAFGISDGYDSTRNIAVGIVRAVGADRLTSPSCGLADLRSLVDATMMSSLIPPFCTMALSRKKRRLFPRWH
jgi:hypothetical protein